MADEKGFELTEETLRELKEYFRFTPADEAALARVVSLVLPHTEEFMDQLYAHYLGFAKTAVFFPDQATQSRARAGQTHYFRSLFTGPYDLARFKSVCGIGEVHDRVGLDPRWYLGAYSMYVTLLAPLVTDLASRRALVKLIFLDAALVWETYYGTRAKRLREATEVLARSKRELEGTYNLAMKALNERAETSRQYLELIARLQALRAEGRHLVDGLYGLFRRAEEEGGRDPVLVLPLLREGRHYFDQMFDIFRQAEALAPGGQPSSPPPPATSSSPG